MPRSPILPPHSGHTQFKIPEITSALDLTVLNLMNCIRTSEAKPRTTECIYSSKVSAGVWSDLESLPQRDLAAPEMKVRRSRRICKPRRNFELSTFRTVHILTDGVSA